MPPILVNKPVEMRYVYLLVPRSIVDRVIDILHSVGAIHVEKLGEEVEEYVKRYKRMNKLLETINSLLSRVRGRVVDVKITKQELETLELDVIERDVSKISRDIEALSIKKRELEDRVRELRELYDVFINLPGDYRLKDLFFRGKYLSSLTIRGRIDSFNQLISSFKNINIVYLKQVEQNIIALLIVQSNIFRELYEKLHSMGFYVLEPNVIPKEINLDTVVREVVDKISESINSTMDKIRELESSINEIIEKSIPDLCKYLVILENSVERMKAVLSVKASKYLMLLGGWVPKHMIDTLIEELKRNDIAFYYEVREPVKGVDEPPTLLENPPVIKWYEPIVKFIGLPRYWEWDPTPIIAYSFALFYGIMLGDMGYAIGIILAAFLILDKFVTDPSNRDYRFFKNAIIVSSAVGFFVGFLGGSFFGMQLFTITDWFVDPIKFLVVALIIGLIHVNISHALTLAKSIKERNLGGVLSETGLFIAEFFGIPYILYTMLDTPVPCIPEWAYSYLLYGAFAGVILIIIGMVKSIGGLGLLMWLFNLTGLLGDVLSYSRLAGVGLATIFLGASFNTIALLAYNGLKTMLPTETLGLVIGGIMAGLILAFGHLLNTALSALGGFIHSLRLCFVEFLSKFYEGTGYPFEPMRIVLRRRVVIE